MRRLLLLLAGASAAVAQTQVLNLSHDLSALGIAAQDMAPDTPALDARPLLEAGVQYAQRHSIPLVTADAGTYYFLTGHPFGAYVSLTGIHDVTIDLAGSDIYFSLATWIGLECTNCQNVQFLNFTLDSVQLPFTQVLVTSADPASGKINYTTLPNWEPATNFNTPRNMAGAAEPLYAFDFRNGVPVRQTSRMSIRKPVAAGSLTLLSTQRWEAASQLANVQAGDVIVLLARIDGPTMRIQGGSNIVVRNVSIYSSSQVGLQVDACPNSTIEQVQIIPRPGTDRLISTNAGGITLIQLGQNNVIRRCRVKRTGDDGMSPNSQELAIVTGQTGTRQVKVTRSAFSVFPNGLQVQFIDNKTGFPVVTAHIVSQDPPVSTGNPVLNGPATLTFDQDIPALALSDAMVYADPAFRGSGLVVENNLIEDLAFARGISLWGIVNGIVRGNVIHNTAWSAINPLQREAVGDWMDGPTQNLLIERNALEQFDAAFGSGASAALAGIDIESDDLRPSIITTGSPSQNVIVRNNFLSTSTYSGIRMQNVDGGSITGNTLLNVSTQPNANSPAAQIVTLLGQPISTAANANVTSTANTIASNAPVAVVTSSVRMVDQVAPGSWASAFGTNFTNLSMAGTTITITDSSGTAHPAELVSVAAGQVDFIVPPDCAIGAAIIAVTSGTTPVGQGSVLVDSVAPALFSADASGAGLAFGSALLTLAADGTQVATPLTQPISLGQPGDVLTLTLYGTGLRNASTSDPFTVNVAGLRLPVQSVGPQGTVDGMDQLTVTLPAALQGAGQVSLTVVAAGLTSNSLQININ